MTKEEFDHLFPEGAVAVRVHSQEQLNMVTLYVKDSIGSRVSSVILFDRDFPYIFLSEGSLCGWTGRHNARWQESIVKLEFDEWLSIIDGNGVEDLCEVRVGDLL